MVLINIDDRTKTSLLSFYILILRIKFTRSLSVTSSVYSIVMTLKLSSPGVQFIKQNEKKIISKFFGLQTSYVKLKIFCKSNQSKTTHESSIVLNLHGFIIAH